MASAILSNRLVFQLGRQAFAIRKTLSNYGKPTVGKDESGQHKVEGEDTDEAVTAVALYAVYIVASAALLAGGVTMYFYASLILDFASACLAILAPIVGYQKLNLERIFGDSTIC